MLAWTIRWNKRCFVIMVHLLPIALIYRFVAGLLALSTVQGSAGPDPYTPDSRVDVGHYVFRIEISDNDNTIAGHTTATVNILEDEVDAVTLNLVAVDGEEGMAVSEVTVDGASASFTHDGDALMISMPLKRSGSYEIAVKYEGVPADGLIISSNRHGDRTFFGDNWPNRARHWLPVVDHPSDKATCEFVITAPAHYQVIASGRQIEQTDLGDGIRLTHTKTIVPLATKVMVFGAARFAIEHVGNVGDVRVETWVYPQDREDGFNGYRPAHDILEFFVDRIGPFPYQKLSNVQSKTRYGGMENAGNIFYSEGSVSPRGTSISLLAHEIAHQWFGDSVSEGDWYHIWLSEGFATYMAALHTEHNDGMEALDNSLQIQRASIVDYHRRKPDSPVVDTTITNLNNLLSTNSYQKGGWVLHMLRREVGDDQFWRIIRTYYEQHRDGNALTSDLQRVAEEVTGEKLGWFFDQWLRRPGQPDVGVTWRYDKARGETFVEVEQKQDDLFWFSLEVGISKADGQVQVHTIRVTDRMATLTIPGERKPREVLSDPNTNLLATFAVEER